MPLAETIERDFLTAMKAKDAEKVGVLRMLKSALSYYKIEKKKEQLEDSEVVEVLQKQAKQRRDSVEGFEKAGRTDLADKEKRELALIQTYLPKQISDEEIKAVAQKVIASCGAKSRADIGRVMKDLMPQVKGKADGKRVNEILSSLLP